MVMHWTRMMDGWMDEVYGECSMEMDPLTLWQHCGSLIYYGVQYFISRQRGRKKKKARLINTSHRLRSPVPRVSALHEHFLLPVDMEVPLANSVQGKRVVAHSLPGARFING